MFSVGGHADTFTNHDTTRDSPWKPGPTLKVSCLVQHKRPAIAFFHKRLGGCIIYIIKPLQIQERSLGSVSGKDKKTSHRGLLHTHISTQRLWSFKSRHFEVLISSGFSSYLTARSLTQNEYSKHSPRGPRVTRPARQAGLSLHHSSTPPRHSSGVYHWTPSQSLHGVDRKGEKLKAKQEVTHRKK